MKKIILITLLFSFTAFSKEKEDTTKKPSLLSKVVQCKNSTYKKMKTIEDQIQESNIFYIIENIKNDHDNCLVLVSELKKSAEISPFKEELVIALEYSEKRLLVDKKVLEIFLTPKVKPSQMEMARLLVSRSQPLRDKEIVSWNKLVNKIKELESSGGQPNDKSSTDILLWLTILSVGGLMYLIRQRKKKSEESESSEEEDDENAPKSPVYEKLQGFVEKLNKKVDEINEQRKNKENIDDEE